MTTERTRVPATPETAPVFQALAWERIHADDMLINAKPDHELGAVKELRVDEVLPDGGLRVTLKIELPDGTLPVDTGPAVDLLGIDELPARWPGTTSCVLDFWAGNGPYAPAQMTIRGVPEHDLGPGYHRFVARLQRQAVAEYRAWLAQQP